MFHYIVTLQPNNVPGNISRPVLICRQHLKGSRNSHNRRQRRLRQLRYNKQRRLHRNYPIQMLHKISQISLSKRSQDICFMDWDWSVRKLYVVAYEEIVKIYPVLDWKYIFEGYQCFYWMISVSVLYVYNFMCLMGRLFGWEVMPIGWDCWVW